MNSLNGIIAVILLFALIRGFKQGLIKQVFSIAGFIAGTIAAYLFAGKLAPYLSNFFDASLSFMLPLSYFLIFIASVVAISIVGRLFHHLITFASLGMLNRISGAVVSTLKYAIIIGLLLNLYTSIDKNGRLISMEARENSLFYTPLQHLGAFMLPYIGEIQHFELKETDQQPEKPEHSTNQQEDTPKPIEV